MRERISPSMYLYNVLMLINTTGWILKIDQCTKNVRQSRMFINIFFKDDLYQENGFALF